MMIMMNRKLLLAVPAVLFLAASSTAAAFNIQVHKYVRISPEKVKVIYLFTNDEPVAVKSLDLEGHQLLVIDLAEQVSGWTSSRLGEHAIRLTPAKPLAPGKSFKATLAINSRFSDDNPFWGRSAPSPFKMTATRDDGRKVITQAEPIVLGQ
jgi:hypothetical protein